MAAKYTLSDLFPGNYPITQFFGARPEYYRQFGLAGHEGVDFALPSGTSLLVPFANGRILRAAWDRVYGYHVVIWDEAQHCAVWYCHLSSISVKPGVSYKRFTVVGKSGRTGNVTGPHLHANLCATDSYANRLNKNNGYQGFLNMLRADLVSWQLSK